MYVVFCEIELWMIKSAIFHMKINLKRPVAMFRIARFRCMRYCCNLIKQYSLTKSAREPTLALNFSRAANGNSQFSILRRWNKTKFGIQRPLRLPPRPFTLFYYFFFVLSSFFLYLCIYLAKNIVNSRKGFE